MQQLSFLPEPRSIAELGIARDLMSNPLVHLKGDWVEVVVGWGAGEAGLLIIEHSHPNGVLPKRGPVAPGPKVLPDEGT